VKIAARPSGGSIPQPTISSPLDRWPRRGITPTHASSRSSVPKKAVKAAWYLTGTAPWGHSVQKLLKDFPMKDRLPHFDAMVEKAVVLDRLYVPTRYPNGLPDLTPGKAYFAADSQLAIKLAGGLLETFGKWMETWK
jgi:HEPN domain-containing protein